MEEEGGGGVGGGGGAGIPLSDNFPQDLSSDQPTEEVEEGEGEVGVAEAGSPVHTQADLQYLHRSLHKVRRLPGIV